MINAEYVPSCTAQQLANSLTKIFNTYARRGFLNRPCPHGHGIEKVQDKLAIIEVNTTAAREHVPDIERQILLIKERVICTTSDFPFDPIPILVLIQIVYTCVMWINSIPRKSGAVQGVSPRDLVTGRTVNDKRYCRTCI